MAEMLAQVALLSPHFATLSYALPGYLPAELFFCGQRVAVPLGNGLRVGVLTGFAQPESAGEGEPAFAVKPLLWPLDREPLLPDSWLTMARELAHRQTELPGRILGSMLPAGLRTTQTRIRFFGAGKPQEFRLKALMELSFDELAALGALWAAGQAEVCRTGLSPLDAELCVLTSDPPWAVRPAAKLQNALLEFLFENGPVTRRKLQDALGKGVAVAVNTLAGRGLLQICPTDSYGADDAAPPGPPVAPGFSEVCGVAGGSGATKGAFCLTPKQKEVFEPLLEAALSGEAATRLLFGITGSGKTAVYLELARRVLNSGRSVLLLAPEVALALKLWGDAAVALPESVLPAEQRHLYHGYQSPAARERLFRLLAEESAGAGPERKGRPRLVIGTRSALLLPLDGIGLIVLDEEHDASFKQDEGFTYQAKELAWFRAQQSRALLLMGSATPDVKSFYAARQGVIPLLTLGERVGGGTLPEVRMVVLPKSGVSLGGSLLAEESLCALKAVVERGEQAIILLNRRGYAPLMYCRTCNSVAKCPHCDIGLAYHKGRERLICHYCGWSVPYPSPCLSCKGIQFLPMGEGTEKLEESLGPQLPPGSGILRLDRDSTRRPGRMEEILAAFARKEASVLVGTQMLSKGHHFPDVTLAIVADADLGLNLPDYRAAERTFQLLLQSAGRSGRGEKPGAVIIQTRDPAHYCWEFVRRGDYEGFFEQELELRRKRMYPPFIRLALIRISHAMDAENGADQVSALGTALRGKAREAGVTLLGPAPAPLPFLKGRKRWHCLLKGKNWQALRDVFEEARRVAGTALSLRLDLDPVNMM